MSDLKIQGVVEMSSEGAERAFDRVADKAGQMTSRVEKEANKAGKAVDSIADGAGKSADEFSRAEGKIVASIKRATTQLEQLGRTASQKLELRISERGLDPARFEPMLGKLRELELAQARATAGSAAMAAGYGGQFSNNVRNASFQIQDFAVQVNGGVDATKALAMQLPQMLVGFGTAGAVIGVVAALLPNIVQMFGNTAGATKTLGDAMSDFNKAIGAVGETVKQFDMDKVYEEFNKANGATKAAIAEQLRFQQAFIETSRLVASKKFGESISGVGDFGTLDKLAGAFGSTGAERLAKQLGIGLETAKELLPTLNGLKTGTEDVNNAFQRFGTALLGGNAEAVKLATGMADLAKAERDAAGASTAISEAQAKMATGHAQTKKEAEDAAKATKALAKEQAALAELLNTINAKDTGFDANYVKNVELLLGAYGKGKLSLEGFNEAFGRYVAMQPGAVAAERERAKASEDYVKAIAAAIDPLEKQANNLERELRYYGMTESAIQSTIIARLEEARAIAAANGAYPEHLAYLDREIDARRRIATASSQKEFLDTNKRAAEAASREWEKFADDINRSLTDALFRAFESGSGFGKSFADTLGNTLKAAVAKALINVAITTGSNALNTGINALLGTSGANNGAGTNYLGLASNASSIYNLANGTTLANIANAYSYGSTALGYTYGTNALSQQSMMLAAQEAGMTGSSSYSFSAILDAIKGYISGTTATTSTAVAAGSTGASTGAMSLGAAAGYMAIIAAVFQMLTTSKTRYLNTQITGTLGPNGLTNGMIGDEYKATGNLLNAGGRELEWRPLTGDQAAYDEFYMSMRYGNYRNNPDALQSAGYLGDNIDAYTLQRIPYTQAQIDDAFARYMADQEAMDMRINRTGSGQTVAEELTQGAALKTAFEAIYKGAKESLQKTADLFGDQTLGKTLENYVSQINIQTSGSLVDAIGGYADALISGMGAAWLPTVESLRATTETNGKKITETWSQTFTRLVNEAGAVNAVFDLLGKSLATIYGNNTDKILAASDAFVNLFGSIDAMSTAANGYYDNFYSAAEKQARTWDQLDEAFAALGVSTPKTREAFRALVDANLDGTAAGNKMVAALWGLQSAFASVTPEIESLSGAVSRNALTKSLQEISASLGDKRAALGDADASLLDARAAIASAYQASQSRLNALLEQSQQATETFANSLSDFLRSLVTSSTTMMGLDARYRYLSSKFETDLALAKAGDSGARDRLTDTATGYLDASRARSRTAVDFARDEARVRIALQGALGGLNVAAGPSLEQQIADAQIELARYQQLALDTGTDTAMGIWSVDGEIKALRAAYDDAAAAQIKASLDLSVAIAALETLGLDEATLAQLLQRGDGQSMGDFAAALDVSNEAINTLQAALGLSDARMAALSTELNAAIGDTIYNQMAAAMGGAGAAFGGVASALTDNADRLQRIADAVGLSAVQFMTWADTVGLSTDRAVTLEYVLNIPEAQRRELNAALSYDPAAVEPLRTILGYDKAAPQFQELASAIGLATQAETLLKTLSESGVTVAADGTLLSLTQDSNILGVNDTLDRLLLNPDIFGLNATSLAAIASLTTSIASMGAAGQASGLFGSVVDGAYNRILGRSAEEQGRASWLNSLYTGTLPAADFENAFIRAAIASGDPRDAEAAREYARRLGIPGFAIGTNRVPSDMLALLHQGERVIPAADNRMLLDLAGGNGMPQQLAAVVAELASVRAELVAIRASSNTTAKTLVTVTRGGDRLLTEAAA